MPPSSESRRPTSSDRPGNPPSDPRLVPVLVAIGYLACVVSLWGLLSLLLNRDAIPETDAGPLLGPLMVLSAGAVVAIALWTLRRRTSLAWPAVAASALSYLAMLVVGTVVYVFTRGRLAEFVLFPARHALSPFVLSAAVLGGVAVVFLWLVTVRDRRSAGKPERHEDI